jgi:drug/metabolite transporter (DMT)-like permease
MGVLFAIGALFAWGVGDFLIQRSTRKFGSWIALFYITAFGSLFLLPFVYRDIGELFFAHAGLAVLFATSFVMLLASLLNLKALRMGKISVVEPAHALEIPMTALLGIFILGEVLSFWQLFFTVILVVGILFASIESWEGLRGMRLEQGIRYGIFGTIAMAGTNFLFGLSSRLTNPLLVNWFTSFFLAIAAVVYLAWDSRLREIVSYWQANKKLILSVSAIDNAAWIFFAYSTLYIPIAVSTGISESYIALAAGLGLIFNREKLKRHQFLGMGLAVAGVILLSLVTDK